MIKKPSKLQLLMNNSCTYDFTANAAQNHRQHKKSKFYLHLLSFK